MNQSQGNPEIDPVKGYTKQPLDTNSSYNSLTGASTPITPQTNFEPKKDLPINTTGVVRVDPMVD